MSLLSEYVVHFSRMVFFYLVTTGWIFYISLCENSMNQINEMKSWLGCREGSTDTQNLCILYSTLLILGRNVILLSYTTAATKQVLQRKHPLKV